MSCVKYVTYSERLVLVPGARTKIEKLRQSKNRAAPAPACHIDQAPKDDSTESSTWRSVSAPLPPDSILTPTAISNSRNWGSLACFICVTWETGKKLEILPLACCARRS